MSNLNDDDDIDEPQDLEVIDHHSNSSSSPQIPSYVFDNSNPRRLLSHPHFIQRFCKYINVRDDFSRAYRLSHINRGWNETMWHYETFQTTFMSQQVFRNRVPADIESPFEVYSTSVRAFLVAIGETKDHDDDNDCNPKRDRQGEIAVTSTSDILMCPSHNFEMSQKVGSEFLRGLWLRDNCTQRCIINILRSRCQDNQILKKMLESASTVFPFLFGHEGERVVLPNSFTTKFVQQFHYYFRGLVPPALERMRRGLAVPKTSSIAHIFRYFENAQYFELYFGKEEYEDDRVKQYNHNNNEEIMKDGEGKLERLLFQGVIPLFYKKGVANALVNISDNKYCFLGRTFYTVTSPGQRSLLHRLLVDFIHNSSPTNFFSHDIVVKDDDDTIKKKILISKQQQQHHPLFINPTRKRKEQLQQLIDAEFVNCFRPANSGKRTGGGGGGGGSRGNNNRNNNNNNSNNNKASPSQIRAFNLFGDAVVGNNIFALKALLEGKSRADRLHNRKDDETNQMNNNNNNANREDSEIVTQANIIFLTKAFDMNVSAYANFFDSLECKYPNGDDGNFENNNNNSNNNSNANLHQQQTSKLDDSGFDSQINNSPHFCNEWRSKLLNNLNVSTLLELAALCGNFDMFEYLWNNFFKSTWYPEENVQNDSTSEIYPEFSSTVINLCVMIGVCPENHDDYLFPLFELNSASKFLWFTQTKQQARLKILGILLNFISSRYDAACRLQDEIDRKKKVEEEKEQEEALLRKKLSNNNNIDDEQKQQQQQHRLFVFSDLPTFAPLHQFTRVSLKKHIENTLNLALASISLLHPTAATRSNSFPFYPSTSLMKRALRLYNIFAANVPTEVMQSSLSNRLISAATGFSASKIQVPMDLTWVSDHFVSAFVEYSNSVYFLLRLLQRPTDYDRVDGDGTRDVASEIHHFLDGYLFCSSSSPSSRQWLTNLVENLERFPSHSPLHHLVESFDHSMHQSTVDAMLTVFQKLLHHGADVFKRHPLVLPDNSFLEHTHPLGQASDLFDTRRPWWFDSREKKTVQFSGLIHQAVNLLHRLCQPAPQNLYRSSDAQVHQRRFNLFGDALRALLRHVQIEFGRDTLERYLSSHTTSIGVYDKTALHLACRFGFWNGVDVMVNEFGADARIKDHAGLIPLHYTLIYETTRGVVEHRGVKNIRDLMKELLDPQEFESIVTIQ